MTKNHSKTFKNNHEHDGASWPYHYNARKHMMVPCQTNPAGIIVMGMITILPNMMKQTSY